MKNKAGVKIAKKLESITERIEKLCDKDKLSEDLDRQDRARLLQLVVEITEMKHKYSRPVLTQQ